MTVKTHDPTVSKELQQYIPSLKAKKIHSAIVLISIDDQAQLHKGS